MMCALHDLAEQDARARALRVRARRGVRGHRATRSTDDAGRRRASSATSRSPASRPTCTSASRPRACWRCRIEVRGRAAHGSTPWLGDNAVLKAIDVFRRIESLPFSRESSELFDRPSINLGRIDGRRRAQQGARPMRDGRRHPLPARPGPGRRSSRRSARSRTSRSSSTFIRPPAHVVARRTRTCARCATRVAPLDRAASR